MSNNIITRQKTEECYIRFACNFHDVIKDIKELVIIKEKLIKTYIEQGHPNWFKEENFQAMLRDEITDVIYELCKKHLLWYSTHAVLDQISKINEHVDYTEKDNIKIIKVYLYAKSLDDNLNEQVEQLRQAGKRIKEAKRIKENG